MSKFTAIVTEAKKSKLYKKLEDIPEDFATQILSNVRALKTNIETFNNKEKDKNEQRKNLIDLIMMQHGVQG